VVCAIIGSGAAVAASSGVTSTTKDAWEQTNHNVDISTTGAVETPILSIKVPAGGWVISGDATLVNFGPSDYAGCTLRDDASPDLNAHGVMVGDPSQPGNSGPAGFMGSVSLTAAVDLTTSSTITMTCSHQDSNGSTPYVNSNADLWVHKVPPSALSITQLP
jgi:hypothetical protein